MKILGMKVRFDKDCPPERIVIMNPKWSHCVDVLSGMQYDYVKGKWVKRKTKGGSKR
jgi:hypothetical protein